METHTLPIIATLQVLEEEEEEDIHHIKIGSEVLKFRKHHGNYRVVMTGPIAENESLEHRVCKIVDLVCGPFWNALENHRTMLTKCINVLFNGGKPNLCLTYGYLSPPLSIQNVPSLSLPDNCRLLAFKDTSLLALKGQGCHGLPALEFDPSLLIVLLKCPEIPKVLFVQGHCQSEQPYAMYAMKAVQYVHSVDLVFLFRCDGQETVSLNSLVTIRQVLQEKSINDALLQLCYNESGSRVSKKLADLILQLQCARHQNLDLNRIFNFIDSGMLLMLAKMQFSNQANVPKSTVRMISNACFKVETKQTPPCNCLRQMTVRFLKCHANVRAWVLVNDLTKTVWAKSDNLGEEDNLVLLQSAMAMGKVLTPTRLNGNIVYRHALHHCNCALSRRWADFLLKKNEDLDKLTLFVLIHS